LSKNAILLEGVFNLKSIKPILAVFCALALVLLAACKEKPEDPPADETTSAATTSAVTSGKKKTTAESSAQTTGGDTTVPSSSAATTSQTTAVKNTTTTQKKNTTAVTAAKPGGGYPAYAQKYAYAGYTPQQADMNPWYLTLLNVNYCLPEGYTVNTADAGNGTALDRRVLPAFDEMYYAAKEAGHTLTPMSGWRSLGRQESNLNAKINEYTNQGYGKTEATHRALKLIMLPGCSEHNAGLAMDIVTWDPNYGFENTKAFAWLMENGAEYGFILRYPKDKTAITGVSFEPWHWRYVGKTAAKEIMARGVCLEEYLGEA